MQLYTCLHPHTIRNPYTKELMSVPCGKCEVCRSNRSAKWVDALIIESKCHKYTAFFTLTYSDDFVPRFEIDKVNRMMFDVKTGELHTFDSLGLYRPDMADSLSYVLSRKYICYYTPYYVQGFIKRLRSKVNYNETNTSKKRVRYFCNAEYGPTTHRLHHHGILFFDSDYLANNLQEIVASCWSTDNRNTVSVSIGRTEVEFVDSSSKSACYVASYVNGLCRIPKIYSKSPFLPKSIFSKSPAIGSLFYKSEDLQEIFNSGVTRMCVKSEIKDAYVYKPLPQAFKDRLYPKLKGFDKIDSDVRYRLYGFLSERAQGCLDYDDFKNCIECYLSCHSYPNPLSKAEKMENLWSSYAWLNCDVRLYLQNLLLKRSSLNRYWCLLNRFEYNRTLFGLSVKEYVDKIVKFYNDEKQSDLADFYDFQSEYVKTCDVRNLINCDPFFAKYGSSSYVFNDLILTGYGFDEYSFSDLSFRGKHTLDYKSISSKAIEKVNNSHKTRCKNEYLEHRDINQLNKIYG